MAFVTGTAENHQDLYAKLLAFLTTNPALVAAGQAWTRVWQSASGGDPRGVVLAGPGLSNDDRVLVGLALRPRDSADESMGRYWINLYGMTGILPQAEDVSQHVNPHPSSVRMYLDPGRMTYWFIANGRRFIVVVKISTVYESLYAGFFLPFATPLQYPYPFYMGGTAGDAILSPDNWRNLSDAHRAFPFAYTSVTQRSTSAFEGASFALVPGTEWNFVSGSASSAEARAFFHPTCRANAYFQYALEGHEYGTSENSLSQPSEVYGLLGQTLGDAGQVLIPFHIVREAPAEAILGVLDGCHRVSGNLLTAESIVTLAGTDHLVVPNTFRAGVSSYFTVELS